MELIDNFTQPLLVNKVNNPLLSNATAYFFE